MKPDNDPGSAFCEDETCETCARVAFEIILGTIAKAEKGIDTNETVQDKERLAVFQALLSSL